MINCLVCGESIAEQDEVCPVCGTEIASLESKPASEQITNLSHTATSVVNLVPQPKKMDNQKNLMPSAEENIHAFLHKLEIQSSSGEDEENIYALAKSLITQPSLDLEAENLWLSPAQRTIYAFFKLLVVQGSWLSQIELLNLWQQIYPILGSPDLISDTILDWCEKHSLKKHLIDIRKTLPGGELNRTKGEGQEHNFRRLSDSESLYNEMFESALIGSTLATSSRNLTNLQTQNNINSESVKIEAINRGGDLPPNQTITTGSGDSNRAVRYTDISCPRQVCVEDPRFFVNVKLTVKYPNDSQGNVENLEVVENKEVYVRVQTQDLIIISDPEKPILIKPNKDSEPISFELKPKKVTESAIINFDFSQIGSSGFYWIGASSVQLEITAYPISKKQLQQRTGCLLPLEDKALTADYTLIIRYDESNRQLDFTLLNKMPIVFRKVDLRQPLRTYAEELFKLLNSIGQNGRMEPIERPRSKKSDEEIENKIKLFGQNLWKNIIPQELQDIYFQNRHEWNNKTLLIISDESYIPWEMVWPNGRNWEDDNPWCLTMRLTRWLHSTPQGNGNSAAPSQLNLSALACIAPTDSGLTAGQREQEFLHQLVLDYKLFDLSPANPTWSEVWEMFNSGKYSWIHVVTHGTEPDNSDASLPAIKLQNGDLLTPDIIIGRDILQHIQEQRPAFVFNACHCVRQEWGVAHLEGWVSRLIENGAGLFLAPWWAVNDELALVFAKSFYDKLIKEEKTVAEAVRESRKIARRKGDLTWLAYSVYSDPNAKVILNGKLEETM